MKKFNKLVRDKIPDIIRANGEKPITRILNNEEYLEALVVKLEEEVAEFKEDRSVGELADVQEVILALADALNIDHADVAKAVSEKTLRRGAFKKRILLERVE